MSPAAVGEAMGRSVVAEATLCSHGSELEHRKGSTVLADAHLSEEDRARRINHDRQRDDEQQRRQQQRKQHRGGQVNRALEIGV